MNAPRVVIVTFESAQILDVTGPLEVFSTASRFLPDAPYQTDVVSPAGGPILASSGLSSGRPPSPTPVGPSTPWSSPVAATWMKLSPTTSCCSR